MPKQYLKSYWIILQNIGKNVHKNFVGKPKEEKEKNERERGTQKDERR